MAIESQVRLVSPNPIIFFSYEFVNCCMAYRASIATTFSLWILNSNQSTRALAQFSRG
jgi:hypothetical protein